MTTTRPRFVVVSLTGYVIGPEGQRANDTQTTEWYVLDRLINHRLIASAKGAHARLRAELRAEALNELHESGVPIS